MTGLFAADIAALAAHGLDDIPVTDRRTVKRDAVLGQKTFEPEVRHHRRNQRVAL